MANEDVFTIHISVRDYECDLQGIVNNAVYLNYLEHARHLYLKAMKLDFAKLANDGIYLVVLRSEVDYRASLRSGYECSITTELKRISKMRFVFFQTITDVGSGKNVADAKIFGTCINQRGRPAIPDYIDALLPKTQE